MPLIRDLLPLLLMASLLACPAAAQPDANYPTHAIRFIVPFPTGGGSDVLMRSIGQKMTVSGGLGVIIDNKPGANGIIAESLAAKAPADGYTVLLDNTNMVLNTLLHKNLSFNAATDFDPVVMPAWVTHVIVVNPRAERPISSFDALLAAMKASPGKITYGSFGTGSTAHLAGEFLDAMAGTQSTHVPYKGGAPSITALLANDIDMVIGTLPLVMPYIKSGQLKPLAVTSGQRIAELPDVPAVAEWFTGYEVDLWWGFFAPAGTPRPIIDKLNHEILMAVNARDVRQRLAAQGFNFLSGTPEQLRDYMKAETAKWDRLIKAAHIKLD